MVRKLKAEAEEDTSKAEKNCCGFFKKKKRKGALSLVPFLPVTTPFFLLFAKPGSVPCTTPAAPPAPLTTS